ncbi:MAG: 23S rRNA (uracil(1939)-C(5))-methyltransferase RlmD [Bacteriovoracaceae bacterium]
MTKNICTYFKNKQCESCDLLNLTYEESLNYKQSHLIHLFPETTLNPLIASNPVFESRNKVKLSVTGTIEMPIIGIQKPDNTYEELLNCPLHFPELNSLLNFLKPFISEFKLTPYNYKTQKGELKYIIILKPSPTPNSPLILRFVLRSKEPLDRIKKGINKIQSFSPKTEVISVNIQPENKAILEGHEEIVLTQKDFIFTKLDQIELLIKPKSFFQTNTDMAIKLYHYVSHKIKNLKAQNCLDLYCGIGAFSFFIANSIQSCIAVEITKEAVDSAYQASLKNKTTNIEFICEDVDLFLKKIIHGNLAQSFDTIIVNPPRRGLTLSVIQSLLILKPKNIVYSSCNYETFYENYLKLKDNYTLQEIQPFDMFPFTKHLEMVATFTLK